MTRFADLIARQLGLFESEHADLLERCDEAERTYDEAPREEAEDRYSEYLELVEEGTDILVEMRATYADTLSDHVAEEYEVAFNRAVLERLTRFALEIEDT